MCDPFKVLILYWIVNVKVGGMWDLHTKSVIKYCRSINRGQTEMTKEFFESWTEGVLKILKTTTIGYL